MDNMLCNVVLGVQIPNTEESPFTNWKRKCNKKANYLVKPKNVDNFSFLCCDRCSHFFSHTEYDFTRIH